MKVAVVVASVFVLGSAAAIRADHSRKPASTAKKTSVPKRISSYAATPTLAHELELRKQAIDNALYLERAQCEDEARIVEIGSYWSSPMVRSCNAKKGAVLSFGLYDEPHEVEGAADDDPRVSYRIKVDCREMCSCENRRCGKAFPVYLGLADGAEPEASFNTTTVAADIHHYVAMDDRGFARIFEACARGMASKDEAAAAWKAGKSPHRTLPDGTDAVVVSTFSQRFLGETSGAILTFGCTILCPKDKPCQLDATMPNGAEDETPITATDLKNPNITRARPVIVKAARAGQLPPSEPLEYLAINAEYWLYGVAPSSASSTPSAPTSPPPTDSAPARTSSSSSNACRIACMNQNNTCFDRCNYDHPVGDSDTTAKNRQRHHYKDCDPNDGDASCEGDNADLAADQMHQLHLCLEQCNANQSSCNASCP